MSTPGIGDLRHRVTLEAASRDSDDGGGAAVTWVPVAELWAAIQPITGDERLAADQVTGRVTHTIIIRHRDGIVPAMRLRQDTRIFEIVAVLDAGRRDRLKCLCEESQL